MNPNDPIKQRDIGWNKLLNSKRIKTAKGFLKYFIITDEFIKFLNKNTLFIGMMMFIMNISSRFVTIKLSKSMEGYLKYTFSKHILIFTIAFIGTRDLYSALVITILFAIFMDVLFNEDSPYCCLPESFTDHHIALMDNSGNVIKPEKETEISISKAPGLGYSTDNPQLPTPEPVSQTTSQYNPSSGISGFRSAQSIEEKDNTLLENMTKEERIHVEKYLRQLRTGFR
jgi:hypothetical protein